MPASSRQPFAWQPPISMPPSAKLSPSAPVYLTWAWMASCYVSAYASFYVVLHTQQCLAGVVGRYRGGLLMGLLMSFVSVTLKAEQGISGIGLYMFGLGLSSLLFKITIGTVKTVTGFQPVKIPLLGNIPVIGEIFFNHSLLVYGAFLLVPIAWWVLEKTTWGLRIKSVGQNPAAADSLGVNVDRVRYVSVCIGAMLAGIAGASLSISLLNLFQDNLTAGQGFIAVALVYFGGWRPVGILWGALLFSTVNAFQFWMQVLGVKIPSDVAIMLPYLVDNCGSGNHHQSGAPASCIEQAF